MTAAVRSGTFDLAGSAWEASKRKEDPTPAMVDEKPAGTGQEHGQGRSRTEAEVRKSMQVGMKMTATDRSDKFDHARTREDWKASKRKEDPTPAMGDEKPAGTGGNSEPMTTTPPKGDDLEGKKVKATEANKEGTEGARVRKRGLENDGHTVQQAPTKDRRNKETQDRPGRTGAGAKSVPGQSKEERKKRMLEIFHAGKKGTGGKGKKVRKDGRATNQTESPTTSAAAATSPTAGGTPGTTKAGASSPSSEGTKGATETAVTLVEEQTRNGNNNNQTHRALGG